MRRCRLLRLLLAKLIVHGADRAQALERLRAALACCRIDGVATNAGLHALLAAHPDFVAGGVDTAWFPKFLAALPEAAHG